MKTIETPMLNKMMDVKKQSEICGEFLEWLLSRYAMFKLSESREEPVYVGVGDYIDIEKELAEFFKIDLAKAEKEEHENWLKRDWTGNKPIDDEYILKK